MGINSMSQEPHRMPESLHTEAINANEDPNQIRGFQGGPAGVGYSQATLVTSLVSLKWRGTAKPCVTCRRNTHLWWVQRYSESGFLDVGFALCQSDAKRQGPIHRALLEKLQSRAREGQRYVSVLVEEESNITIALASAEREGRKSPR